MVEAPPRHGKSELISNWIPTWYLDTFPTRRIILASYAAKLAAKWGRKVRTNLEMLSCTRTIIRQDSRAADRFETTKGGGMITSGVGGAITGEGASLIIIDDPIKNWQEAQSENKRLHVRDWFNSTLYTRMESDATIILLQTRWHEDDLAGYLIGEHDEEWTRIRLPALAEPGDPLNRKEGEALCPERYSAERLAGIRKAVTPEVFEALYQQNPTAPEGADFNFEKIRYWTGSTPPVCQYKVITWDLTFKGKDTSAYNVGQVWGANAGSSDRVLIDQVRVRAEFSQQIEHIEALSAKHPDAAAVLIEDAANGAAAVNVITDKVNGVLAIPVEGSKDVRAKAVSPKWRAGNIVFPNPAEYPWVKDTIMRFKAFPNAKFKDEIDAAAQGLIYIDRNLDGESISLTSMTKQSAWRR